MFPFNASSKSKDFTKYMVTHQLHSVLITYAVKTDLDQPKPLLQTKAIDLTTYCMAILLGDESIQEDSREETTSSTPLDKQGNTTSKIIYFRLNTKNDDNKWKCKFCQTSNNYNYICLKKP